MLCIMGKCQQRTGKAGPADLFLLKFFFSMVCKSLKYKKEVILLRNAIVRTKTVTTSVNISWLLDPCCFYIFFLRFHKSIYWVNVSSFAISSNHLEYQYYSHYHHLQLLFRRREYPRWLLETIHFCIYDVFMISK